MKKIKYSYVGARFKAKKKDDQKDDKKVFEAKKPGRPKKQDEKKMSYTFARSVDDDE